VLLAIATLVVALIQGLDAERHERLRDVLRIARSGRAEGDRGVQWTATVCESGTVRPTRQRPVIAPRRNSGVRPFGGPVPSACGPGVWMSATSPGPLARRASAAWSTPPTARCSYDARRRVLCHDAGHECCRSF